MRYQQLQQCVIIFLVLYAAIGLGARFLSTETEDVYPFFSWFLFERVPPRVQTDMEVLVHAVGKDPFPSPLPFREVVALHNPARSKAWYYTTIQQLGNALEKKRADEAALLRKTFEETFIHKPVTYEVVQQTYNPIDRFLYHRIIEQRSLGVFYFPSDI